MSALSGRCIIVLTLLMFIISGCHTTVEQQQPDRSHDATQMPLPR